MILKIHSILILCACLGYLRTIHALKKPKRSTGKRSGDDVAAKYAESEPGFDLTDEDMNKFNIWPDGVIPYYIDQVSYDKVLRDRIRSYLDNVNGLTGLTFSEMLSPPTNDSGRWVFFINRKGQLPCKDHSMKDFSSSGVQKVILGYDCMSSTGDIGQIILALAGVPPQHNAPNRDYFIEIAEGNILPDKTELFQKLGDQDWLFHDVEYDFNSAGHFSFLKHTANGAATIRPKGAHPDGVGETRDFSESDIWKIRMLYNYITAKKKSEVDECDKLFEPGVAIAITEEPVNEVMKPRKKPNKYLGLPEDASNNASNDASNDATTPALAANDDGNGNEKDDDDVLQLDASASNGTDPASGEPADNDDQASEDEVVSDDTK